MRARTLGSRRWAGPHRDTAARSAGGRGADRGFRATINAAYSGGFYLAYMEYGAEIEIDDRPCGHADLPLLMLIMSSVGPSVGYDHGSAVSTRYTAPFPFAGRLHEIVIQASPGRLADAVAAGHAAEMARQ